MDQEHIPPELKQELDDDFRAEFLAHREESLRHLQCHEEYHRLHDFAGIMEDHIEAYRLSRDVETSVMLRGLTTRDIVDHHSYEKVHNSSEEYAQLLRQNLVITLCALVDVQMHRCSEVLSMFVSSSLRMSDIRGRGPRRARLYLDRVCGVEFDSLENDWGDLNSLANLRNILVHGMSISFEVFRGRMQQLRDFRNSDAISIRALGSYLGEELSEIMIGRKFVQRMLETATRFADGLAIRVFARCETLGSLK